MKRKDHPVYRAIQSVLAACFGVQSEKNMKKDVQQKDPYAYIITGIIVVGVFVWMLLFFVKSLVN